VDQKVIQQVRAVVTFHYKGKVNMKKILMTGVMMSVLSLGAQAGVNTTALELKIYKFAVSTSPNCSNLTTVITNSNPSYQDFKGAPDLGSGELADGTYPCVAIEFSDQIRVSHAGPTVSCSPTFTQDVCRDNGGGAPTSTQIDGSTTTCTSGEDRVVMYITTAKDAVSQNWDAFNRPGCNTAGCGTANTDAGIHLGSSLTVAGAEVGKFTVNTDGKVCDGSSSGGNCTGTTGCEMLPPDFSFSQI
jgi:hypothetical protein